MSAAHPISEDRLSKIATSACDAALDGFKNYDHSKATQWTNTIINTILKSLTGETSPAPNAQPLFKYIVTSTIIQHAPTTTSHTIEGDATEAQTATLSKFGRRGMHSAVGAYWNSEKDGMWSYKYMEGEKKGFDVVINVVWIAL